MRFLKTVSMICVSFMIAAGTAIAITAEDADMSGRKTVKRDTAKAPAKEARFKFGDMRQDELMQIIEILESQIGNLKKAQEKYKNGVNTEYGEIQNKIEELESERAMAHKTRSERAAL